MKPALVLASSSPRRRDLLARLGLAFEVVASRVAEAAQPDELPEVFSLRVAREKADEVAGRCPERWVLAADTVVVRDGQTLGKPATPAEARAMLRSLSGQTHRVLTAVALRSPNGTFAEQLVVESAVTFRALETAEIEEYLESGEPFDKAGAYAVQGLGARFIVRVEGSYTNVVGLPLDQVRELLARHGVLVGRGTEPRAT